MLYSLLLKLIWYFVSGCVINYLKSFRLRKNLSEITEIMLNYKNSLNNLMIYNTKNLSLNSKSINIVDLINSVDWTIKQKDQCKVDSVETEK